MVNDLNTHLPQCQNPNCSKDNLYKTGFFFIIQAIEEIKRQKEKENQTSFHTYIDKITINGHGQVNFGQIKDSVLTNAVTLANKGQEDISHAIKKLTEAVTDTYELNQEQKEEYLDILKFLSEEALKNEEDRQSKTILKAIIRNTLGTLNTLSSLSTVTGITLPQIAQYFLSQNA
jgi:hypothetical protein